MGGLREKSIMKGRKPSCKLWWKSRTLWINAFMAGLAALEYVTGVLQFVLPINAYAVIAVVIPVVNAILRVVTTQGLYIEKREVERHG